MQPMRIHNLTQAQDPGKLCMIDPITNSLASKPRVPWKRGSFVWVAGTVLLREVLFCLKFIYFQ